MTDAQINRYTSETAHDSVVRMRDEQIAVLTAERDALVLVRDANDLLRAELVESRESNRILRENFTAITKERNELRAALEACANWLDAATALVRPHNQAAMMANAKAARAALKGGAR